MPPAVAAADPPDEPPGVRFRSHGFEVVPHVADEVHGQASISGTQVLPTITAPAARKRATTTASTPSGEP